MRTKHEIELAAIEAELARQDAEWTEQRNQLASLGELQLQVAEDALEPTLACTPTNPPIALGVSRA